MCRRLPTRWASAKPNSSEARWPIVATHSAIRPRHGGQRPWCQRASHTTAPAVLFDRDLCAELRISLTTLKRLRRSRTFPIPELPSLDKRHRYSGSMLMPSSRVADDSFWRGGEPNDRLRNSRSHKRARRERQRDDDRGARGQRAPRSRRDAYPAGQPSRSTPWRSTARWSDNTTSSRPTTSGCLTNTTICGEAWPAPCAAKSTRRYVGSTTICFERCRSYTASLINTVSCAPSSGARHQRTAETSEGRAEGRGHLRSGRQRGPAH